MLKRNLLANFAGTVWSAVLSFAFIPFYVRQLGVEAYGIVGFAITLQSLLAVIDLGLSASVNRELARSVDDEGLDKARRLVATLQIVYWGMGLFLAGAVYVAAPWVSLTWFARETLHAATITHVLRLFSIVIALQFPFAFYSGGLLGLHRHPELNGVIAIGGTLRSAGAAIALVLVAPTLSTFFVLQAIGWLFQTGAAAVLLFRALGFRTLTVRPSMASLRTVWRFAFAMTTITLLGALLSQIDKVVLSRVLPLSGFGYYTIAASAASAVILISGPFFATTFPRFSTLVAAGDEHRLATVYHQACQLLSAALIPVAAVLIAFAPQILQFWTGDAMIVRETSLPMALLAAGFALNALHSLPHALQLASGWTRLAILENSFAVLLLIPAAWYAGSRFGGAGAAAVWMLLNLFYVIVGVSMMHQRLLRKELGVWWRQDVLAPLFAVLVIVLPAAYLLPPQNRRGVLFIELVVVSIASLASATLATRYPRTLLFHVLANLGWRSISRDRQDGDDVGSA